MMRVSRRGFLGAALAAPLAGALARRPVEPQGGGAGCVLRESASGFGRFLAGQGSHDLVVFPGAAGWDRSIPGRVRAGATVIFESAAGFGDAEAFHAQQAGIEAAFGLSLERPVLVSPAAGRPRYIDLLWPTRAKVRDFSSLVPVRGGEAIGVLGALPVAALRREGAGRFLFVGSPVGPALWSGDTEASAWLSSVVREVAYSRAYR
jgi:hypothetical protein